MDLSERSCIKRSRDFRSRRPLATSGATEGQQSNLRRAIPTDGKSDRSQARVRIESEPADLVQTPNVLPGQLGQEKRFYERQSHLASMGMP